MKWKVIAAVALLVPLLIIVALAVMSASARRPKTLGVREGRFAPCPDSPNCVSTQSDREEQRVEPLWFVGHHSEALERVRNVLSQMPRAKIVTQGDNYLHVEFTSALFRFVDDVEFFVDHEDKLIHFRSASRAGKSDLGVNRQRMEAIVEKIKRLEADHFGPPKTDR